jgi:hypothetical protein
MAVAGKTETSIFAHKDKLDATRSGVLRLQIEVFENSMQFQ